MSLVVLSAKEKKGTYEGKSYHNVVITALDEDSTNEQLLFGPDIEIIKIKAADLAEALKHNADRGFKRVRDLEGAVIVPHYNKFGNCFDFTAYMPEIASAPENK